MEARNLKTAYGPTVDADKRRSLTEAGMTISTASTTFPDYYKWWKDSGKTDATFLNNLVYVARWNDAFFKEDVHKNPAMPAGSGNIYIANGVSILANAQVWWPYGQVEGSGNFINDKFDTELRPDLTRWVGDPKKKNLIVSPSYGRNDMLGYPESAKLDNVRLYGNKPGAWVDTSFESSGVVGWDMGEGSMIARIKSDFFNDYGVCLVRATPAHIQNLSAFCNGRAALGLIGTALGTMRVDLLSGDDNCAMIEMLPGYGREAGGNLSVGSIKLETSTTPEGTWGPTHVWKGQLAGKLRGQYNVHIAELTYASPWIKTGQLFWVDDRLTDSSMQQSRLEVRGKGFGFAALIVDSARGIYFDAPPDYSAWHAVYQGGKLWVNGVEQTPKPYPVGAGPMGFARAGQTLNFANATPQQQVTGTPPPVTCTWVPQYGSWSTCVNGTQTRTVTYVSSAANCTPPGTKPQDTTESQPCGTTPPPSTVVATLTSNPVTNTCQKVTVDWKGVTTLAFKDLVPNSFGSKFICSTAAGKGIVIGANGSIWFGDNKIKPDGTLTLNQPWSGTLTIPATDFVRMGDSNMSSASNCNGSTSSFKELKVSR